jgi:hypothetical protein
MSTRPITDTLRHIGGGAFIDTASDKLAELVAAVDSSGKAGRIDLTITVKKATRGGAMHITGKVKLTKPARSPWRPCCSQPQRAIWSPKTRTSRSWTSRSRRVHPTRPSPTSRPRKEQAWKTPN